jgi:DNA-directed RNA polymerase subunit M/transcription elongation factor TFIIS
VIRCSRCGSMMYEDECWHDEHNVKMQDLACFHCPKRIDIKYTEWLKFKKKLEARRRDAASKSPQG